MWIDTHAHLYCEHFDQDLPEVLERATQAGVGRVIVPSEDIVTSSKVCELCKTSDMLFPAVGIHPEHAAGFNPENDTPKLRLLAQQPEVVALGEMGLDYYWDTNPPPEVQLSCLKAQIELALELDKPVIIHNRNADADTAKVLESYKNRGLRGVVHCFSTTYEFAMLTLECGFYISFAGQLTYPKSQSLRDVAAKLPANRVMLETDSPYLSPQKKRGKRNEPGHTVFTGKCLAELLGLTTEQMAAQSTKNAEKLFGLPPANNA